LSAVQAIEAELDRRMTYRLDSPVPPRGADAVDDALFVSHSGFCEQFATAEVVLLRSVGVPARIAVGFSGGESGTDGFRTFHQSDAHAWVEVWFPEVGWVTSDPTPAADDTETRWQQIQHRLKSLFTAPLTWVLIVLVLALVTAVVLRVRRRAGRVGPGADPVRTIDPDLAAAFARLEAELLAEGRPRSPNETVAALARRLDAPPSGLRTPASEPSRPEPSRPEASQPEQSELHRPEQLPPKQLQPDQRRLEELQPEQLAPERQAPEQQLPEQQLPEQQMPEQQRRQRQLPEWRTPEQLRPQQLRPDQSTPGAVPGQPVWSTVSSLQQAFQVLERALYAPSPPSRQECLTAATAIDQRGGSTPNRSH
jgi:hypothetical protein